MTTEEMVNNVRLCGESMMDHAESIVGDYIYQADLTVTIRIPVDNNAPTIEVHAEFFPDGYVKRRMLNVKDVCL